MQQTMNQRMVSALHKNQLVSALCFESSLINFKKNCLSMDVKVNRQIIFKPLSKFLI